MEREVKVVIYGMGEIGKRVVRALSEKKGVKVVGAIDIAESKIGKDVGELAGLDRKLGVVVSPNVDKVLGETKPDVVIHMTQSYFKKVFPQLVKIVEYGANVVSTCEELSYPYIVDENLAKKLDSLAKEHGVTILGTGINPGFLMDTLVITLTGACVKVNKIKVTRVINASTRREPFQRKIGAGLSVEEFNDRIKKKIISGHVGLEQSIALIASALGWKLDKIVVEDVKPVVAEKEIKTDFLVVKPGQVAGLMQIAKGIVEGEEKITLDFRAFVGAPEEYDAIEIDGLPPINEKIVPCVHGDWGTVAMVINSIPKVINAPPGLKTMKDLPVPSATPVDLRVCLKS